MRKNIFVVGLMLISIFTITLLFAQTVEQIEKATTDIDKEKLLREKVEKEKKEPLVEEEVMPPPALPPTGEKVAIKDISVIGATLLSEAEVNKIISPYKNKTLLVRDMQEIADKLTDAYRQKGYITSRAYLPPQRIREGMLEIRILEGITGDIEVKGNRHFKKNLIRKKIALKKGQAFDYEALRKGLSRINELPDRNAKAVLVPGKEPGTTDVVLEVKDRLPIHIGFDWDNYGSRYVDKNRLRTTFTHNNFLGKDDVLTLQYQLSDGENYTVLTSRYIFPLNESLKIGFFAADSKIDLRQEYEEEDLNARGKSRLYSVYLSQSLIDKENANLNLNIGFDYKDSFNFQQGIETSRDRMRVVKTSLDLDLTDTSGRTMLGNEINYGIGSIMGGLEKRDTSSSRSGAGGEFLKNNLYLLRLQRLPFNATMLWKNQAQLSSDILPAVEQFQIGGIINVRGYPAAEVVGDRGCSMTWELSNPFYLIPRQLKVPFSEAKLYDALRIVTFYDWANARLRRPGGTEEKRKTLRAVGCGIRFNLPENFSLRVETAWPLDNTPSDNDHAHTWLEVSKTF